jgi:glycosyltransferase involved in cell wall biosynthesis
MKILFLVSSMAGHGAERVAATLVNAWASRGDQVVLMPTFSGRGECFYELSPAVRLIYLADLVTNKTRSAANQIARLRTLRQFIVTEQPDVIVSFLSNVNVAAVAASLGLKVPVIICERTDPFVVSRSRGLRLACRVSYPFATILMVQTQAVAAKYIAAGWSAKCLRVIANPIPEQIVNIQHKPSATTKKLLLSIGRLNAGKQFDVLIRVFANLAARYPEWSLRILGEGELRASLQQQINDLNLADRIALAGQSAAIGEELAQADVFAFTSKYEGFPNVLLEAMGVGVPCISFDCPSGPREMSLDGQVALLVALNDEAALERELERLMQDADLRDTLGTQARASIIERFALANILTQWDTLFQELGVR